MEKSVELTAHAEQNGLFVDNKTGDTYMVNLNGIDEAQSVSYFLMPQLSRWFNPESKVRHVLHENDAKFPRSSKWYPKHRGVWRRCPSCGFSNTCGAVFIHDSTVFINHCLLQGKFNFGKIEEEVFIKNVNILENKDEN